MKRTATNPEGPTGQGPARFADAGTVLLLVFLIGSLLVLAGFTVGEDDSVLQRTLSAGSRGAVTVACWMFAATGFGVWFLRWLPEELSVGIGRGSRLLASMGLGTAVLLWLDSL
ncbi:MAG: hypothetical protein VXX86_06980, partial [Planctomycetota bacterium]|nr:hypothetical protein [Planctomycetota bacterium]